MAAVSVPPVTGASWACTGPASPASAAVPRRWRRDRVITGFLGSRCRREMHACKIGADHAVGGDGVVHRPLARDDDEAQLRQQDQRPAGHGPALHVGIVVPPLPWVVLRLRIFEVGVHVRVGIASDAEYATRGTPRCTRHAAHATLGRFRLGETLHACAGMTRRCSSPARRDRAAFAGNGHWSRRRRCADPSRCRCGQLLLAEPAGAQEVRTLRQGSKLHAEAFPVRAALLAHFVQQSPGLLAAGGLGWCAIDGVSGLGQARDRGGRIS